jgi:YD repeat-containing protein
MRITYDEEVDVVRIEFRNAVIAETDEDRPGILLDYDAEGNVVSIEILEASRRMENPRACEYALAS